MTESPSDHRCLSTASLDAPPHLVDDVAAWLTHSWDWFDPSHAHPVFWPDRPYQPGMEILVAGCGPSQAAMIAYTNPQARVTAIDADEEALNHEIFLRHKHKLLNLDVRPLHPMPIEDVGSLNRKFDLVIASGFPDQMSSSEAGMKALGEVLRRDGVAAIGTTGLTVTECVDLVDASGLVFQDWFNKMGYYPTGSDEAAEGLLGDINGLPERQIWSAMEALNGTGKSHLFTACRPERSPENYRIDFSAHNAADYVPIWRVLAGLVGEVVARHGLKFSLQGAKLSLSQGVDGERSIRQISEHTGQSIPDAVEFFEQLWRMDFIAIGLAK